MLLRLNNQLLLLHFDFLGSAARRDGFVHYLTFLTFVVCDFFSSFYEKYRCNEVDKQQKPALISQAAQILRCPALRHYPFNSTLEVERVVEREKGIEEGKHEVALRLIDKGVMFLEEISEITGLSEDDLRVLQKTV